MQVLLNMILPANDGHPVKRVKYATEVTYDKTDWKENGVPETTSLTHPPIWLLRIMEIYSLQTPWSG